MLRPILSPAASLVATAAPTAFNLPVAFNVRGGAAAAAAFDMGLAKTRLEGLAYSTVTTLLMNTALVLFSSTKNKERFDKDGDGKSVANLVSGSKTRL